ncbi:MAG: secretin N-terminal domain-containing protein [Candidatus Melainabacteria bacterium]|nr:secretin N-terminal domain-containing protein [Candidatus Melainabacteria bacterium]
MERLTTTPCKQPWQKHFLCQHPWMRDSRGRLSPWLLQPFLSSKRLFSSLLAVSFAFGSFALCGSQGYANDFSVVNPSSVGYEQPTSTVATVNLPNGNRMTSLDVSKESVRQVLRDLAMQYGFNLILDSSVQGTITLALQNITVNEAVQAIAASADLEIIPKSGNIFIAMSRESAREKGLRRELSKVISLKYANAKRVATLLNRSLFPEDLMSGGGSNSAGAGAIGSGGGGAGGQDDPKQRIRADLRTNSLIVVGSRRDIELVEDAVSRMDRQRESKTFYLSHANALDVAGIISSSIFNDGVNPLVMAMGGGAGGAGGAGGGAGAGGAAAGGGTPGQNMAIPSPVRVNREELTEGEGINAFGANDSSSGNSASNSGPLSEEVKLRAVVKKTDVVSVSPDGPLVIPDTRINAVTILGTAEQIAQAERLIPVLDAKLPQVAIEASLVEITDDGLKELGGQLGIGDGKLNLGFNNQGISSVLPLPGLGGTVYQPAGTGTVGLPTVSANDPNNLSRSGISYTSRPLTRDEDFLFQIRALMTKNRAKILANPTIIATHDSETIISIVDEIIRRVTVTTDGTTGVAQVQTEVGEAGIVLDILPKIGDDGTINMRVRPSISTIGQVTADSAGNTVTLLKKRDLMAQQVRIKDGQTLVLGGLIQETATVRADKLPLLGDAPIVGALLRSSSNSKRRSELVVIITPHILNATQVTPVSVLGSGGSLESSSDTHTRNPLESP